MHGNKLLGVGCLVVAAASLWLRWAVPVWVIYGPHDDLLFVRLAQNLRDGLWLGTFDNLTLAKGMGYPAFMVASSSLGIPLKIAEQSAYLGAAGLATWLVARLVSNRWTAFSLFVTLAFNPILWHPQLARVIREGLYVGLSFAVVMLWAIVLLFPPKDRRQSMAAYAFILITLGALGAVYWLTREEGAWIAPAILVLLGSKGIDVWREEKLGRGDPGRWQAVTGPIGALTAVIIGFAAPVGIVSVMNYVRYGAFIPNEVQSSSFTAAYGALSRISHDEWRRWIVFPGDVRAKAYGVSEAARELRPTFEGPTGDAWRRTGCPPTLGETCPEILGGWFIWAFRDAVAEAGHYSTARDALAFYDRLAAEISAACDDGRLSCHPTGVSIFPPFRWHYVADLALAIPATLTVLTHFGEGLVGFGPTDAPNNVVDLFAELVGPVSARTPTSAPQLEIAAAIARVYAGAMPILTTFGLIGVLVAVVLRPFHHAQKQVLTLALACGAVVVGRALLMGYMEVTLGPGVINERYASPASPFLISFVTLGFYLGGVTLRERLVLKH